MAIMLIWNNHAYWSPNSSSYPGHASLSIDEDLTADGQAQSYVSWWPDQSEIEKFKPIHDMDTTISSDLAAEGYAPDHIIEIGGLRTGPMLAKWRNLKNDTSKRYRYLRQNCSTIVSQVLKLGSDKGSMLERNNVVWTPNKVKRLAFAMGGVDITWTELLMRMRMAGYMTNSDTMVLKNLCKRDERHGKGATDNAFYYSGGRSVVPKMTLMLQNGTVIGPKKHGMTYMQSEEGSLLTLGTLAVRGKLGDENYRVWQNPDPRANTVEMGNGANIRIGRRLNPN